MAGPEVWLILVASFIPHVSVDDILAHGYERILGILKVLLKTDIQTSHNLTSSSP